MLIKKKTMRYLRQKVLKRYGKDAIVNAMDKYGCKAGDATLLLTARLVASHEEEHFFEEDFRQSMGAEEVI